MTIYALYGFDNPAQLDKRIQMRPVHLARIKALAAEGRVVMAGPLQQKDGATPSEGGFAGSLLIAEFDSLEAATTWWQDDVYIKEGVFARFGVHPYFRVPLN